MPADSAFDVHVQTIVDRGYPATLGIAPGEIAHRLEPLRALAADLGQAEPDIQAGILPFVIVIPGIDAALAMSLVERRGKPGLEKLFPLQPTDFTSIPGVEIPDAFAYLLVDIDRGRDSINVTPAEALIRITEQRRSPLTIHEGIACVTQYPEFLARNNCYSLAGSRQAGDKRVPAIWINAKGNPRLGWCWDGNPHTWLGTASCARRIAPSARNLR
jgi:hypothetical protein